jgi:hypothetical protein
LQDHLQDPTKFPQIGIFGLKIYLWQPLSRIFLQKKSHWIEKWSRYLSRSKYFKILWYIF